MTLKTKKMCPRINGEVAHTFLHHWSRTDIRVDFEAAIFNLLWVIVRPFLLFLSPQKLVSASFNGTMATQKSDIANKTNIKRDKSQRSL